MKVPAVSSATARCGSRATALEQATLVRIVLTKGGPGEENTAGPTALGEGPAEDGCQRLARDGVRALTHRLGDGPIRVYRGSCCLADSMWVV
jgi:hypothetical protein